ncbi:hypothetical protein A3D76_02710 [Candidatus Roizmanbacteria bacterium RIFCSPHIGHO2_02_FULL_37_9b]|nr:MAG: hypothetical protein A3D76_02710 [Candidatus Roizmanbacteria bacterium RIFCSPHIGHO2_02_FULL_37_9b]
MEMKNALKILAQGGLVVSPSDTVYGLLVDATNEAAVKKLIQFKNRPPGKPISVFVSDFSMLQNQVIISKQQFRLVEELLPGPFTVILPSKHNVSILLESEKGTLGVRIPHYKNIIDLVKKIGKPVSATSANLSGRHPHYSVVSLMNELPEKKKKLIDFIIDAGQLPRNKPSTVIDLTSPKIKIVRQGDIVFKDKKLYTSDSPSQTKKIAQYVLKKLISQKSQILSPVVFIIEGELGVGKTIFVKGIAESLGIKNIISPSFVIYYEYSVTTHPEGVFFKNKLIHIDLYNIQDPEELQHLGLEKYLKKENLLCFEWGEKAGEIINSLKNKGKIIYVKMKYVDEKTREIQVKY